MQRLPTKWEQRYIDLAEHIATWSKDLSTQVGAVLVNKNNCIIAVGYNGFPPGVADDERLLDRPTKYEIIVHAEINAILSAGRSVAGCTLYTVPFLPCSRCASLVITAGIDRVIAPVNTNPRWEENLALSRALFEEALVEVIEV